MVVFVIGCIAVMVGVAMVGFGIPISEFSFGNTLIVAGTTLGTGGLIIIGLSVVAKQLNRIAEGQGVHLPSHPSQPVETFELPAEARPAPAPFPFPPQPAIGEPHPAERPTTPPVPSDLEREVRPGQSFAPAFRKPEASPVTVEDEVSLSPPMATSAPGEIEAGLRPASPGGGSGAAETPREPSIETRRSEPPVASPRELPSSYFDNMWPAKSKISPVVESQKSDLPPRDRESIARTPAPEPRPAQPRSVAILKSGVVEGMAYTLYVDGSIEAELPQGTLHFASIDELRSHLEKNS